MKTDMSAFLSYGDTVPIIEKTDMSAFLSYGDTVPIIEKNKD
jgi:hypothetical protein